MNIATKLLKLRIKQAGISQEKMAEYAGVSKAAVCQWEKGATSPTLKHLVNIRRHIEFSFDELLEDEIRRAP